MSFRAHSIVWLNRGITTDRTKAWETCATCGVKVQGAHTCKPKAPETSTSPDIGDISGSHVLPMRKATRRGLGRGLADSLANAGVK